MANQPCPTVINECPCDISPFKNLSSEAPDLPVFFRTNFARVIPPLGTAGGPTPCQVSCDSTVSQEAADLCASELGFECSTAPWTNPINGNPIGGISSPPVPPPENTIGGNPFPRVFSQAQFCGAPCPDGSVFTYTVPAGIFSALAKGNTPPALAAAQATANSEAFSFACRQAQLHMVCLGPLNVVQFACVNTPYLAFITATGRFLAVAPQADDWELIGGQLPTGLTFHGGAVTGGTATIDGTPTQIGTFTFTIQITTPSGDMMTKQYTITVGGIPNAGTVPAGNVGTAYSFQLMDVGFVDPVFSLVTGTLPDGLSLNTSGLISGTPTTAQTTTATVQVAEASGVGACQAQVSITIKPGGFQFNLVWGTPATATDGDGAVSSVTTPTSATVNASASGGMNLAEILYQNGGNGGNQTYTSVTPINCNVKLTLSGTVQFPGGIFQGASCQIFINNVFSGSIGLTAPGTANLGFTLPAGVNQHVEFAVSCTANTSELGGQGANLSGLFQFTVL